MSSTLLKQGEALYPGEFVESLTVTLVMQRDANLVLYPNGLVGAPNVMLWASGTRGDNTAVLQEDGNFVIYPSGEIGNSRAAEWATHTRGDNVLEVQNDGNVVIYPPCCIGNPNAAEWATNTPIFGTVP